MKTIHVSLDNDLLQQIDRIAGELRTTRSAFMRDALRVAIRKCESDRLEAEHRKGYEKYPVVHEESAIWEDEQVWGDR